ncbi:MAG TPA: carbamoyltransferase HypF [Bryobacteraceae bacterium]|nr:carbamoyltransferase HypF [Bryobacteraceae bacterium]
MRAAYLAPPVSRSISFGALHSKVQRSGKMFPDGKARSGIGRRHIHIRGIVQGVGFRPFVFNLARRLQLSGYVLNSSAGVVIEAEGPEAGLEQFVGALNREAPPLARIENFDVAALEPAGYTDFVIRESLDEPGELVPVSPDVSTCDDCMRDFRTASDRRHGYPFTNCTNCGPRYTITRKIPYDRPLTTMACFAMCERCLAEYEDPGDRRFHAQPNACPQCGPSLSLALADGLERAPEFVPGHSLAIIGEVRRLLREGRIVAIKGLGGFHLACDPANEAAVRLLRERKKRSDKPFALMVPDIESAERFCVISDAARAALVSSRRPIVILPRRDDAAFTRELAPGNNTLGVMLPYTPLHYLLFGDSRDRPPEFPALVMTSGNLSEEPIVTGNREAAARLNRIADAFLFHNRDIHTRVDDSVVRIFEDKERVLRRSRGYAPFPVTLQFPVLELLACGAELKNTFCLTKRRHAFLSQHIGDLENYETMIFFQQTLERMKELFRIEPAAVAYDLHPMYLSTKLALAIEGAEKIGVQHHHAHVASCMAENGLTEKVIGVAFDGTGYGTDGKIWGGEFLVADYAGFERRAHLRYVPLAGGDTAVREPWRLALSYLLDTYGPRIDSLDLPLFRRVPAKKVAAVRAMIEREINSISTSACGRLFDAVASIAGVRDHVNFEAQAAIELEMSAARGVDAAYPFAISSSEPAEIDMRPAIEAIVKDVIAGRPCAWIAAAFHNTVAAVVLEVCRRLRGSDGIRQVCLSGGTFQNLFLLERAVALLRADGFEVFLHAQVPPNDGGIALGQGVIANRALSGARAGSRF